MVKLKKLAGDLYKMKKLLLLLLCVHLIFSCVDNQKERDKNQTLHKLMEKIREKQKEYSGNWIENKSDNYPTDLIDNNAQISVENNIFDFGEIVQGEIITATFKISNPSSSDLIIKKVRASCGCTTSNLNKDLLKAGEEEIIEVTFNSKNKIGKQEKTVSLLTNAMPNTTILTIKGNVIIPENK